MFIKSCQWLASITGSLVLEATTLATVPYLANFTTFYIIDGPDRIWMSPVVIIQVYGDPIAIAEIS